MSHGWALRWVVLFPDTAKLFQPRFLLHVLTKDGASAKLGIVVLGHVGLDDLLAVLPHHSGPRPLAEVLIERGAELRDVVLLVLLAARTPRTRAPPPWCRPWRSGPGCGLQHSYCNGRCQGKILITRQSNK